MTTMQKIKAAKTLSQLHDLLYRAESAEENAAICLREAEIVEKLVCKRGNDDCRCTRGMMPTCPDSLICEEP